MSPNPNPNPNLNLNPNQVSLTEQRLLIGVRQKLDALLASKIDSPELDVGEAGKELLAAVSQVLASN